MKRKRPVSRTRAVPSARRASGAVVVVENVNVPGYTTHVNGARYAAVRAVLLRVLPRRAPGATQAEMFAAVKERLPADLFPGGAKANWWAKTVQLDLEAKGIVQRSTGVKPLRWYRAK